MSSKVWIETRTDDELVKMYNLLSIPAYGKSTDVERIKMMQKRSRIGKEIAIRKRKLCDFIDNLDK